jgi:hypothetical protein
MEPKFTPCGSEVFVKEREVGPVCLVGLVCLVSGPVLVEIRLKSISNGIIGPF